MRFDRRRWLAVASLCIFAVGYAALDAAGADTLGRGRQILLNGGLQLQSLVYPYPGTPINVPLWSSANFTTFDVMIWSNWGLLNQLPAGTTWSREYSSKYPSTKYLSASELPYASKLAMYLYGDEMSDAQLSDPATLNDMAATYADWRLRYPTAMVGSGFTATMPNAAILTNYMQVAQPDLLMFNHYPSDYDFSSVERNNWYSAMQRYRTAGLAGNDGTGTTPLAYGQYLRLYRTSTTIEPVPTESFVRLQQNASWAFGYTFANAFLYGSNPNAAACYSAMFATADDSAPNAVFDYVKETNRQSRNLGPALVRLASTDVQMIRGSAYASRPSGISRWGNSDTNGSSLKWQNSHTADTDGYTDYITGIAPMVSKGGAIDTTYGDILIGYLKPLLSDNKGCTFADGLHFMIVNGSVGPGTSGAVPVDANGVVDSTALAAGTADALAQWYRVMFDFTGSDFDSLVRLSRDTGKVELVTLAPMGGSTYALDLYLPGGTGDLFAFWDRSDPLPSLPEPGAMVLLTTGLIGALAYTWKKMHQDRNKRGMNHATSA